MSETRRMMRYKRLGTAGIKVSELRLGTMTFGALTDEKTAGRILGMFLERILKPPD